MRQQQLEKGCLAVALCLFFVNEGWINGWIVHLRRHLLSLVVPHWSDAVLHEPFDGVLHHEVGLLERVNGHGLFETH